MTKCPCQFHSVGHCGPLLRLSCQEDENRRQLQSDAIGTRNPARCQTPINPYHSRKDMSDIASIPQELLDQIAALNPITRVSLMHNLNRHYCDKCGAKSAGGYEGCTCYDDEDDYDYEDEDDSELEEEEWEEDYSDVEEEDEDDYLFGCDEDMGPSTGV